MRVEGPPMWQGVRSAAGRYREMALAGVILAMAGWELLEIWMLEWPLRTGVSRTVALHALQVALVVAASYALLRAWHEKTANQRALGRMTERAVFAQEEERRRVAFELHDGVAQLLVSAKQHLDTCRDLTGTDEPAARRELTRGLDRLGRAVVELRRVLFALRPSLVDTLGLAGALRTHLEETAEDAGWSTTFVENVGNARFGPALETAVVRIAQEALANAWRHAATRRVAVELRREGGWLVLTVRDFGLGLARRATTGRPGLGLLSMQERAELLGGTLAVEGQPGEGTWVQARLPVAEAELRGRAA